MSATIDTLTDKANADIQAYTGTKLNQLKADIKAIQPAPTPTPTPTPTPVPNLYDDFKYIEALTPMQYTKNGKWLCSYNSNGSTKMDGNGLIMVPGGTALNIYSGSALLRSTQKFANFRATIDITNEKQVYTKDAAGNPITPPGWQCGWVIFRHLDKWRHWYVLVGVNHMEIGKKDVPLTTTNQADIEKGQMILWTGGPATAIGQKRKLTIEFIGNVLKISLDGVLQKTIIDDGTLINSKGVKVTQSSYNAGEFCPYVEGAQGRYQNCIIEVLP